MPQAPASAADIYRVSVQSAELVRSDAVNLLRMAAQQAGKATQRRLRTMQKVFEQADDEGGVREGLHRQIGEAAHAAVKAAYIENVVARKKTSSYREGGNRMSGGLKRALWKENFFKATPQGLSIINTAELDKEARHWQRLNFGAGAVGTGSLAPFKLGRGWGGHLGLNQGPRPAFLMPRGVWLYGRERTTGPGGFYPKGKVLEFPTKGIEARNFLDQGVRVMAEQFPEVYEQYYKSIFNQVRRKGGGGPLTIYVRGGSGRGLPGISRPSY